MNAVINTIILLLATITSIGIALLKCILCAGAAYLVYHQMIGLHLDHNVSIIIALCSLFIAMWIASKF